MSRRHCPEIEPFAVRRAAAVKARPIPGGWAALDRSTNRNRLGPVPARLGRSLRARCGEHRAEEQSRERQRRRKSHPGNSPCFRGRANLRYLGRDYGSLYPDAEDAIVSEGDSLYTGAVAGIAPAARTNLSYSANACGLCLVGELGSGCFASLAQSPHAASAAPVGRFVVVRTDACPHPKRRPRESVPPIFDNPSQLSQHRAMEMRRRP